MHTFSDQLGLPCVVMRGGTSKGPFFLASDLPAPGEQRDRVLLRVLGALEPRRIDGIGGPDPLVNKIAIISSTLLEAIAIVNGFNPEGGTKNFNFNTRKSHSSLADHIRIAKGLPPRTGFFLRAESFFNVATEIENLNVGEYYGGKSLHEQSHGESFMTLLTERFGAKGLYILDEPESALSPQRQLAALFRIHDLIQQGSQFLIATHSPILLAYPDSTIYQFSAEGIDTVSYQDTDTFQIMKAFINNPEKILQIMNEKSD